MMHVNTYFLQKRDRYQDVHQDEEYQPVPQASQTQLLQQDRKLNDHLLELMGITDPKKTWTIEDSN